MIKEHFFKDTKAVILENDSLKVIVLPELGGKIASVYNKTKDFELLFQNKEEVYKKAGIYSDFGEYDASGFDDAFPSIDEGIVTVGKNMVRYPDHGEIWSMGFKYEIAGEKLTLKGESAILSYSYTKTLSLQGHKLIIDYNIANGGESDIPCLWAMHCLIRCEEDMQLIFPEGTNRVRNVLKSGYLGEADKIHTYPATTSADGKEYRLDRIFPESAAKYEKYYVEGEIAHGVCGAYYPGKDVTYRVYFDSSKLPYLGFWLTEGGFRGDYNCAMEPANGFYDSIETARNNNSLYMLKAGTSLSFDLKLELK